MPRLPNFMPPGPQPGAGPLGFPGGQQPRQPARGPATLLLGDDGKVYCPKCTVRDPLDPRKVIRREAVEHFQDVDDEGFRVSVKMCTACGVSAAFRESIDIKCEACGHVNRKWKRARPARSAAAAGPIQFRCPHAGCGQVLEAPPQEAGTNQRCPKCARGVTVPGMRRGFDRAEPMPAPQHSNAVRQPGAYGP